MKVIQVKQMYYAIEALYGKAKTKTQRALLGYMVKFGYANDPIYGGAFRLVSKIESCIEIYKLETKESADVEEAIISIAEQAMFGLWDEVAFTEREIKNILIQHNNLQGKGGK